MGEVSRACFPCFDAQGRKIRACGTERFRRDVNRKRSDFSGPAAQGQHVKLARIAIFGAGYVFGTKAGRERYEQIVAAAKAASQRLESYGNGGRWAQGSRPGPVNASDGDPGQQ
jgi:hypothetical protein